MKILGMVLLLLAMAGILPAGLVGVPEIDPGSAGTAVALLSGTLLILRSRCK